MAHAGGFAARVAIFVLGAIAAGPVTAGLPSPFTEEAVTRGLNYIVEPWPQTQGFVGHGVGFADLDSDGDPDVIVMGAIHGKVGIFENIGGGVFVGRPVCAPSPCSL